MTISVNKMVGNPRSHRQRLILSTLCLIIFFAIILGLSLVYGWNQTARSAAINSENLGHILADNVARTIQNADIELFNISNSYIRRIQHEGIVNPKEMDDFLALHAAKVPEAGAIHIADETGTIIFGKDVSRSAKISVADREYFIKQRDDPNADLVISKPLMGRIQKSLIITISRRLEGPNHKFYGIIYSVFELSYFTHLFSEINVGRLGSMSLRSDDWTLLAHFPETPGDADLVGKIILSAELKRAVNQHSNGTPYRRPIGTPLAGYPGSA